MRILIAGCGDLGTALGVELAAAGDEVFGLRRHPLGLPDTILPIAADLERPATLLALPAVDAVVYAAAAEQSTDEAYRRVYVGGLRHLLASPAFERHPPRRFLFVSSTAVYAQNDGAWIDESSPAEATHFRAARLLEAEALARSAGSAETLTTVVRLAGIYGPGRTRLIELVRAGRATYPPGPPRYGNRIHRDDAAGALAHLLRLPAPRDLYLGVDDAPDDLRAVLAWLAGELGAPPPRRAEAAAENSAERTSKRCSNARLKSTGYRLRFPTFRDGYAALLRSIRPGPGPGA